MGGVARRATVLKAARATAEHFMLLDAGNSLLGNDVDNLREPAGRTHGQTSVEILNRLGYDVVALGESDLRLGRETLLKRLAEAPRVSFVSANVVDKGTGKLVARPYVIRQIGGHRIALIGITGSILGQNQEFNITPPLDAVREAVRQVGSQAGIIILLSNAGAQANRHLASQVPELDLIISGGYDALSQPVREGQSALIAQADLSSAGHAGRVVGKLQVGFDRSGALTQHTWGSIELGPDIADDPDLAAWVASLSNP